MVYYNSTAFPPFLIEKLLFITKDIDITDYITLPLFMLQTIFFSVIINVYY